jgi:hypothetical protein
MEIPIAITKENNEIIASMVVGSLAPSGNSLFIRCSALLDVPLTLRSWINHLITKMSSKYHRSNFSGYLAFMWILKARQM